MKTKTYLVPIHVTRTVVARVKAESQQDAFTKIDDEINFYYADILERYAGEDDRFKVDAILEEIDEEDDDDDQDKDILDDIENEDEDDAQIDNLGEHLPVKFAANLETPDCPICGYNMSNDDRGPIHSSGPVWYCTNCGMSFVYHQASA